MAENTAAVAVGGARGIGFHAPEIPLCLGALRTQKVPLAEGFIIMRRPDSMLGVIYKATGDEVARYEAEHDGRLTLYLDMSKPPALVAKYVIGCGLQRRMEDACRKEAADREEARRTLEELSSRYEHVAEISCLLHR